MARTLGRGAEHRTPASSRRWAGVALGAGIIVMASCTASDPGTAGAPTPGSPLAGQDRCATERSHAEGGDASTVALDELLVREPPRGYEPGAETALSVEDFIGDAVAGGEQNEQHFRELLAPGATGIYERSFLPPTEVDPTFHLMRDTQIGYGVIYAFVVCFDTVDAAAAYALDGAQEAPPQGSVVSLPVTNGRLTRVRSDHAVTALMRSGRAVISFSQWTDDGNVTVDLESIDDLVARQAERSGSTAGS